MTYSVKMYKILWIRGNDKMAKITRNIEMNLSELIDWIFKNKIKSRIYYSQSGHGINVTSSGKISGYSLFDENDRFSINVCEEVTKDTKLGYILIVYKQDDDKVNTQYYCDESINSILNLVDNLPHFGKCLTMVYYDDKKQPHLIWHEGELAK